MILHCPAFPASLAAPLPAFWGSSSSATPPNVLQGSVLRWYLTSCWSVFLGELTCFHNSKVHAHDFHVLISLLSFLSTLPHPYFSPQSLLLLPHSLSELVAPPSLSIYIYYTVGYLRADFNQEPDSFSFTSVVTKFYFTFQISVMYVLFLLSCAERIANCFPTTFLLQSRHLQIYPTHRYLGNFPKYKLHHAISLFKIIQRFPIASG